jgi:hypothetical protein
MSEATSGFKTKELHCSRAADPGFHPGYKNRSRRELELPVHLHVDDPPAGLRSPQPAGNNQEKVGRADARRVGLLYPLSCR